MKTFAKIYVALLLAFMYAPILALVVFSFTDSPVFGVWNGFSLDLYRNIFNGEVPELTDTLWSTLIIAMAVTFFSVILGTSAAIGLYNLRHPSLRRVISFTNSVPLINPDVITAMSLFLLFVALGISRGYMTVIFSQTVVCTPFVMMCVLPMFRQMDPDLYLAAVDLGASRFQAVTKVILPQLGPGILSGALLTIALSIDDFAVTLFNRGNDGLETLSTYIYADAQRGGLTPEVRPLFTLILVVAFVSLLIVNIYSSRREKIRKKIFG